MISGFNTDIEHDGVVYHVQTEDKGLRSAELMTLVYNRGTILASKRSSYEDLTGGEVDTSQLSERLNRQHKLICAAIRAGRIDELVKKTRETSAAARKSKKDALEMADPVVDTKPEPAVPEFVPAEIPTPIIEFDVIDAPRGPEPAAKPTFDDHFVDVPVIKEVRVVEEEIILDPSAVAVVSELSGTERPAHEKLTIELFGESRYKSGDRVTLTMLICRGSDRRIVPSAQIMVKALGSAFRPVIFHAKSDANGLAKVHLQIPVFKSGRAALLIRVGADGEEVELRRMIVPG